MEYLRQCTRCGMPSAGGVCSSCYETQLKNIDAAISQMQSQFKFTGSYGTLSAGNYTQQIIADKDPGSERYNRKTVSGVIERSTKITGLDKIVLDKDNLSTSTITAASNYFSKDSSNPYAGISNYWTSSSAIPQKNYSISLTSGSYKSRSPPSLAPSKTPSASPPGSYTK